MEISRRSFLGTGAAMVAGTMASRSVFGANERIRMCVVGCGGRGGSHIGAWTGSNMSDLVAVVDADERPRMYRARMAERAQDGKEVKMYADLREALADGGFDAISIATPHHWHALATQWGIEAGVDVFVEKPMSWSYFEGQALVALQKKYPDRIIYHGAQRRSDARWRRDVKLLQSGEIIGAVYMARGLGYKNGNRGSLGFKDNEEPPSKLAWDLWQGPASRQAFNASYHPYNWHWFWHYGNGEIGNQGVHQMDLCSWVMESKGMPVKVFSEGGRYTYDDMGETPNTNVATLKYADGTMSVFEVRNRFTNNEGGRMINGKYHPGVGVGNLFYADEGYYVEGQGFFDTKNEPIALSTDEYPYPEGGNHYENFLKAIKSRNPEDIRGNAEEAHLSSAHCHLANISYRVGKSLDFDPESEQITNAADANAMLTREYAEGFEVTMPA